MGKDCLNYEKAASVGQEKEHKDLTCAYDAEHGHYEVSTGGKPTQSAPKTEPNKKSPFTIKK